MTKLACSVERCLTGHVDRADASAMLQKQLGASYMATSACNVERCSSKHTARIDVGTVLQEQPSTSVMIIPASSVERCFASVLVVHSIDVSTLLQQ